MGATVERNLSGFRSDPSASHLLLGCGVLAGPLYLVVGIAQALLRDGFDFSRHPLSVLANGPGGWVQTANFVITGFLVLTAAIGLRRALAPKSRALSVFLGAFGASRLERAVDRPSPGQPQPVERLCRSYRWRARSKSHRARVWHT